VNFFTQIADPVASLCLTTGELYAIGTDAGSDVPFALGKSTQNSVEIFIAIKLKTI